MKSDEVKNMTLMDKIHKEIKPYMAKNGFLRKGRIYYRISHDISYCIGFDNPGHNVHAYFFLMPLYIRSEFQYLTYGERLNILFHKEIPVLDKTATDGQIIDWVNSITNLISAYVLPFFQNISTPEKLLSFLSNDWEIIKKHIHCPPLDRLKLKMFTLLYLHRKVDAMGAIEEYREELKKCDYLVDRLIVKYNEEANMLESLASKSDKELDSFFAESIDFTRRINFSK